MSQMIAFDAFLQDVTERRVRALGLVKVFGVEKGTPVYFRDEEAEREEAKRVDMARPRLPAFPGARMRMFERDAITRRINALPKVTPAQIRAAGFDPGWD